MEIRIRGLTRDYHSEGKRIRALDNVDLTIPANRIFTLLGPSGCGKTTLLRCIVGLETPDAGEIAIGDEIVWSGEKGIFVPPEKRGLGMVFQTYAIWPHMTVFENVAYPLQCRNVPKKAIRTRVAKFLEFVQLADRGLLQAGCRSTARTSAGSPPRSVRCRGCRPAARHPGGDA